MTAETLFWTTNNMVSPKHTSHCIQANGYGKRGLSRPRHFIWGGEGLAGADGGLSGWYVCMFGERGRLPAPWPAPRRPCRPLAGPLSAPGRAPPGRPVPPCSLRRPGPAGSLPPSAARRAARGEGLAAGRLALSDLHVCLHRKIRYSLFACFAGGR